MLNLKDSTGNILLNGEILEEVLPLRNKTRLSIIIATADISQCNKTRKKKSFNYCKGWSRLSNFYNSLPRISERSHLRQTTIINKITQQNGQIEKATYQNHLFLYSGK